MILQSSHLLQIFTEVTITGLCRCFFQIDFSFFFSWTCLSCVTSVMQFGEVNNKTWEDDYKHYRNSNDADPARA